MDKFFSKKINKIGKAVQSCSVSLKKNIFKSILSPTEFQQKHLSVKEFFDNKETQHFINKSFEKKQKKEQHEAFSRLSKETKKIISKTSNMLFECFEPKESILYYEIQANESRCITYEEYYDYIFNISDLAVENHISLTSFVYYATLQISDKIESLYQEGVYLYDDVYLEIDKDRGFLNNVIGVANIEAIVKKAYYTNLDKHKKTKFLVDKAKVAITLDQLSSCEGIADGTFLYEWTLSKSNNGTKKFQKASDNFLYKEIKHVERYMYEYIFTHSNFTPYIRNILEKAQSYTDLGTGGSFKLGEFLKFISPTQTPYAKESWYIKFMESKNIGLVDINAHGYMAVKKELDKKFNNVSGIETNFLNMNPAVYNAPQSAYFMFGCTIGNFTDKEIDSILQNMKSKELLKSNHGFFTYFSAPDKNNLTEDEYTQEINKIKAMYGDDVSNSYYHESAQQTEEDFVLSGFESLGFDRSKLKFIVEYEEGVCGQPDRIKQGVELLEDITIDKFSKKKGDKIRAIQSKRFKKEDRKSIADRNGYNIIVNEEQKGIGVCVLQSKIGLINKYKNLNNKYGKVAKIYTLSYISSLALMGAMFSTMNYIEKKEILKEKNKQELLKKKNYTPYQELSGYKGFDHNFIKNQSSKLIKKIEGTLLGDQEIGDTLLDLHKQGYDISYNIFGTSKEKELYLIATFLQEYITDPKQKEELEKYDLSQKIEKIIGYHANLGGIKLQKGTIEYNRIYGNIFNQMSFYGEANERITDDERIKFTHDKFWEFKPVKDK